MSTIACGNAHIITLDSEGNAWAFGKNQYGQLGVGDTFDRAEPCQITGLKDIISVSAKCDFSCCLDFYGRVWFFGNSYLMSNRFGAPPRTGFVNEPKKIEFDEKIIEIKCGNDFILCLDDLGNNHLIPVTNNCFRFCATEIKLTGTSRNIVSIACGDVHAILLSSNGLVYGVGNNEHGQLGLWRRRITISYIGLFNQYYQDDSIFGDSAVRTFSCRISSLKNIIAISCGNLHSIFLSKDDKVFTCGNNSKGQLGSGSTDDLPIPQEVATKFTGVKKIYGAYYSTIVVDSNGTWIAGSDPSNFFVPSIKLNPTFIKIEKITYLHTFASSTNSRFGVLKEESPFDDKIVTFGEIVTENNAVIPFSNYLSDDYPFIISDYPRNIRRAKSARK